MSGPEEHVSQAEFETFDLSVNLGPDLKPWVSASSRLGVVHGVPRGGGTATAIEDLLDLVYDYADSVHFAEPQASPALANKLTEIVFGDPEVLALFQATRGSAADRERQLLVRILASPHFSSLPWELLADPTRERGGTVGRYLTLAPDAHVARLARGRTYPTPTHQLVPPLNLLVALSSPSEDDPSRDSLAFDIFEVKQGLLAQLKPLEDAGLLTIDVEDRPTLENLRRRVGSRRGGYHLFHYVGHAAPDVLVLEDESGRSEEQSSDRFAEVMRLCPDLRLMVFAGCETARPAGDPMRLDPRTSVGWRDLLSLADRCVQDVSPVVIGMQAVLPFRTERLFTRFFYQGLATGYSVAHSLRLARGATRGDRRVGGALLDWSVPVMLLGGGEPGPLVPRGSLGTPRPASPRRDLKLGLRQPENRFFARDVALRQAVDVLSGRTRERVLVVTGPAGVGKTALIDRALQEVERAHDQLDEEGTPDHVLYVKLARLAPQLQAALTAAQEDDRAFHTQAAGLEPESILCELCQFVAELLTDGQGSRPIRDPSWAPCDWWDRLVEELTRTPFLIVIDDVDLLDEVEFACLVPFAREWLAGRIGETPKAKRPDLIEPLELLAAWLRNDRPDAIKDLREAKLAPDDLLRQLEVEADQRLVKATWRAVSSVVEEALDLLDVKGVANPTLDVALKRYRNSEQGRDKAALKALLQTTIRCREVLDRAFRAMADRRSRSRLVLAAAENPAGLGSEDPDERFEMRVGRLTWKETWRWIRRNLPGLVGQGEEHLFGHWARLGTDLDRWDAFEREVVRARGGPVDTNRLLDEIAPRPKPGKVRESELASRRRGDRALRIAAAGPALADPAKVADAIARLATEHGVGGRVVVGSPEGAGALAVLIDEPSPFRGMESPVSERSVLNWLRNVARQRPDIVLLDYGANVQPDPKGWEGHPQRKLLRRIMHRCLLVGSGGNDGQHGKNLVLIPAAFPEVLAVGPARPDGSMQPYASRNGKVRKPDLFMQDGIESTPLYQAVNPKRLVTGAGRGVDREATRGSTFASLHAIAAAVLVWSLQPWLSPRGVRRALLDASKPIPGEHERWAKFLRLEDALARARRNVVERALAGGACSIQTLSAITGLEGQLVRDTVEELGKEGRVRRLPRSRIDRFVHT